MIALFATRWPGRFFSRFPGLLDIMRIRILFLRLVRSFFLERGLLCLLLGWLSATCRLHILFHFASLPFHPLNLLLILILFFLKLFFDLLLFADLLVFVKLCRTEAFAGHFFVAFLLQAQERIMHRVVIILKVCQLATLGLDLSLDVPQPLHRLRISEVVLPVDVGSYPLLMIRVDLRRPHSHRMSLHRVTRIILVRLIEVRVLKTQSRVH